MIFPNDRYKFSSRKKINVNKIKIILLIALVFSIVTVLIILKKNNIIKFNISANKKDYIITLWNNQKYSELISYTNKILLKKPLNKTALVFNGFANFYEGITKYSLEEKLPFMDAGVFKLRKSLLVVNNKTKPKIYYMLGKCYYYKGKYYYDLALSYLQKSVEANFINSDSYEYIGLCYSNINKYKDSIVYFSKAIKNNPSDILLLTMAQTYQNLNEKDKAIEFLLRTINKTKDKIIEEKSRTMLGNIYIENNDLFKAEEQFNKIITINENSSDAYYFLGLIFDKMNDKVKARSYMRNALRIDPNHQGAILYLYK